ncbi:MAG TPA: hypoxanthine phosphoribosyltransferase [Firmicutes bacterium]|jgi:hypoxanthine phosphoribosyltransferase|nr:hypoxanthine phosphoribosyltransferase [Bacillota bacterium]
MEQGHALEVLLTEEEIADKVSFLGEQISRDYAGSGELVLVAVLRGSVYFAVDLSRCLAIPFVLDFIGISSYAAKTDPLGIVRITKDLDTNIASKNVLLVEDIVDTGLTLNYLLKNLRTRKPLSLRVCALLDMPARRIVNVPVDYRGFEMPDVYVVGYGLDYQERYRNLKEIAVLK